MDGVDAQHFIHLIINNTGTTSTRWIHSSFVGLWYLFSQTFNVKKISVVDKSTSLYVVELESANNNLISSREQLQLCQLVLNSFNRFYFKHVIQLLDWKVFLFEHGLKLTRFQYSIWMNPLSHHRYLYDMISFIPWKVWVKNKQTLVK